VDFVIVGSGAAGGVMARELSRSGFSVVVLEQGPRLGEADFKHDELAYWVKWEISADPRHNPQTFRRSERERAQVRPQVPPMIYARVVGGSSVHFTANFWRFHPIDFIEGTLWGEIPGASLADWPITYEDLEPYYTKVDWEVGVSGQAGTSPFDPPRSRPYPMRPLPVKSSGVLFEKGCREMGWHAFPAPLAIASEPYRGRPGCVHCGFCMGFGCEVRAKSSSLVTMIPESEATGRCEVRAESRAVAVEMDRNGRTTGVRYLDRERTEHLQRARAVVLCGNGAETPRLLFLSETGRFPDGLANSSGLVGRHLMVNGQSMVGAAFEHELNEFKSVQVTRIMHDFYDSDPKRGFYGGGGIDARLFYHPIYWGLEGFGAPDAPWWGAEYKNLLRDYPRTMFINGHTTSLPVESNSVTLDPDVKDAWGLPALRMTYRDHPDDLSMMRFLHDRSVEIAEAAGAGRVWRYPVSETAIAAHLLGTCRMGTDPRTSVVDSIHRTHDVPNLFICDGSSLVTSGRGQPTMTIMALAFRAAERIGDLARRGEI
jgi:choline dehydrogenase-like flavoprotein